MGGSYQRFDFPAGRAMGAAGFRHKIRQKFEIAVRTRDGGEIQIPHLPTQGWRKFDDGFENRFMYRRLAHNAMLANAIPASFKLRLDQAQHPSAFAQHGKSRGQDQADGDE